jgi:hypothetical protein
LCPPSRSLPRIIDPMWNPGFSSSGMERFHDTPVSSPSGDRKDSSQPLKSFLIIENSEKLLHALLITEISGLFQKSQFNTLTQTLWHRVDRNWGLW